MNLKLKNIILPSEITKQKVVISLTVVAIAIGGLFYFITKDDAMPAAVKEKTAIVVINDNANSAKINQIINKEENASDDKIDSIISSKQPTSHVLMPIIKISNLKPTNIFNTKELNTKLYSNDYLLNNSNVRNEMVNYCANNLLKNQIALANCNTASKVDRSWYQFSYLTSRFIKQAFNSGSDFGFSVFFVLIGLYLIFNIFKVILFFTPNYSRQKTVYLTTGADGSNVVRK